MSLRVTVAAFLCFVEGMPSSRDEDIVKTGGRPFAQGLKSVCAEACHWTRAVI
ncbi:hypothetical protein RB213_015437 [Colletotrichum asianum]